MLLTLLSCHLRASPPLTDYLYAAGEVLFAARQFNLTKAVLPVPLVLQMSDAIAREQRDPNRVGGGGGAAGNVAGDQAETPSSGRRRKSRKSAHPTTQPVDKKTKTRPRQ